MQQDLSKLNTLFNNMIDRTKNHYSVSITGLWRDVCFDTNKVIGSNVDPCVIANTLRIYAADFSNLSGRHHLLFRRIERHKGFALCQELADDHKKLDDDLCMQLADIKGVDMRDMARLFAKASDRRTRFTHLRRDIRLCIDQGVMLIDYITEWSERGRDADRRLLDSVLETAVDYLSGTMLVAPPS